MAQAEYLHDNVPESCRELLTLSANELRSAIPELARDRSRMNDVEQAVQSLPSRHEIHLRDARNLSMLDDESIHLMVTSPPYFNIKNYENGANVEGQLGDVNDYQTFNDLLDDVWSEVYDKLVPGGRMVVVVGDVLLSRSDHGRHRVLPLHATIQQRVTQVGFDNLAPIIWYKIGNASLEAGGNARFLGKPYEPGAVVKNDIEYILLFRKPGQYRSPSVEERILSTIEADEHQRMFRQLWDDIQGEIQGDHPAPYPVALAERLVRMFSFVGDTVLDPFAGTGSTAIAASRVGRNSVSTEVAPKYVDIIESRFDDERSKLTNYEKLNVDVVR